MSFIKTVVAAFTAMLLFVGAFLVTSPAFAEERTVFVIGFDFTKAEVVLQDEDGFLWTCPFGQSSWTLGEEYVLTLEENQVPQIQEP